MSAGECHERANVDAPGENVLLRASETFGLHDDVSGEVGLNGRPKGCVNLAGTEAELTKISIRQISVEFYSRIPPSQQGFIRTQVRRSR